MSAVTASEVERADATPAPRRARMMVKRLEPWTVLKFSLLFYFCLMLVAIFGLLILWWVLGLIGVTASAAHLLSSLGFGSDRTGFHFDTTWIFLRVLAIGVAGVVFWSIVNVFAAILYNLVADIVGGVEVTMSDGR